MKQNEYEAYCDKFYLDYCIPQSVRDDNTHSFSVLSITLDPDGNIYSFCLYNRIRNSYEEISLSSFNWDETITSLGYN